MKVFEIDGSPRRRGNTELVLDLCEQEMNAGNEAGDVLEYERIGIYDCHLNWCRGCRICLDISEEKCPDNDGLLLIKKKMEEADIIIIGSPVYVEDVSGGIKNWMDRMAFNCHRPFLMGKPVYVYTTSAAKASNHAGSTMKRALTAWGGNVRFRDNFILGASRGEKQDKNLKKIIRKRMKFILIENKKHRVSLMSLIAFAIQKHYWEQKEHTADYEYWMNQSWFEQDCIYYRPVQTGWLKKLAVAMISKIVYGLVIGGSMRPKSITQYKD